MAANPCMGCRAAGLPKCDFACERAAAYYAIRREGREQVYAEIQRLASESMSEPHVARHPGATLSRSFNAIRARLGDTDSTNRVSYTIDVEARADGTVDPSLAAAVGVETGPVPPRALCRHCADPKCDREWFEPLHFAVSCPIRWVNVRYPEGR